MFTLFPADYRSQNLHLCTVFPAHNSVNNLVNALLTDFASTVWTVSMTTAGIKQAVKIIYFSDCTHSRTWVFVCRFLFNRNGRRQALNQINIRLIHTPQKLAGIRRKTFHITTLAFGKKRIKSKRRLTRTAQTGNYNQLIPRKSNVNIL